MTAHNNNNSVIKCIKKVRDKMKEEDLIQMKLLFKGKLVFLRFPRLLLLFLIRNFVFYVMITVLFLFVRTSCKWSAAIVLCGKKGLHCCINALRSILLLSLCAQLNDLFIIKIARKGVSPNGFYDNFTVAIALFGNEHVFPSLPSIGHCWLCSIYCCNSIRIMA